LIRSAGGCQQNEREGAKQKRPGNFFHILPFFKTNESKLESYGYDVGPGEASVVGVSGGGTLVCVAACEGTGVLGLGVREGG